jgi:hypothetical protein
MKLERITWGLLYPPKQFTVWENSKLCACVSALHCLQPNGVTSDVVSVCWNVTLCRCLVASDVSEERYVIILKGFVV